MHTTPFKQSIVQYKKIKFVAEKSNYFKPPSLQFESKIIVAIYNIIKFYYTNIYKHI